MLIFLGCCASFTGEERWVRKDRDHCLRQENQGF
jgi:hypothetical protein